MKMDNNNNWNEPPADNDGNQQALPPIIDRPVEEAPRKRRNLLRNIVIALLAIAVLQNFIGFGVFNGFNRGLPGGAEMPNDGIRVAAGSLTLDITMINSAVIVQTHSGNDVLITYQPARNGRAMYQVTQNGGRVEVVEEFGRAGRFGNFGIGRNQRGILTVNVPRNTSRNPISAINISVTSGSIQINGYRNNRIAHNINVRATSGGINLNGFTAGDVSTAVTSGGIAINSVTTDGVVSATATSGGVRANDVRAGGDITLRTTSGGIRCDNVRTDRNMSVTATSGGVRIDGSRIDGALTATATSGGVNIYDTRTDENRMNLSTTSGGIRVNGQRWSR